MNYYQQNDPHNGEKKKSKNYHEGKPQKMPESRLPNKMGSTVNRGVSQDGVSGAMKSSSSLDTDGPTPNKPFDPASPNNTSFKRKSSLGSKKSRKSRSKSPIEAGNRVEFFTGDISSINIQRSLDEEDIVGKK